ncbi:MAG: acyl-CoA dehydratase activase [Candidatus Sumerlaeota bacterium]|nr:acyl-CoA dehydratase activase [Candidatus Sumerlaeota bacterium]
MSEGVFLGFDVGSVFLKAVAMAPDGRVAEEDCRRANGRPLETASVALRDLLSRIENARVLGVATTGGGGEALAEALGGCFVNEIIALSVGIPEIAAGIRTAIDIGGQDSKLLLFAEADGGHCPALVDFSMNSVCAAGTGSFLDQQATRLGVAIEEEFGRLALLSEIPPRIAGRCSVFAKSDMIHLQQIATPVHDIIAGLCLALARGFKSTVGKGKEFLRPIAFLGGVASNAGMVMAFEKVLNLAPGELRVPPHHRSAGAIGAVQHVRRTLGRTAFHGVEALEARLAQAGGEEREGGGRLRAHLPAARAPAPMAPRPRNGQRIEVWVGIDVGSISTNVVVLDRHNHVLAKRYLPTAGRPIEAVRRGLEEIGAEIGDRIEVEGAGATGSGRHLIGRLVGADVIRNEITAQATAAAFFAPDVDTVFEIGGQDSKFIRLDHGTVCDFEMNRACAAGTGSFLEEQAERLNVDLKREFSALALDAPRPAGLGDRCTVFMESDLIHHQQQGAGTPDLLAGLAYSIVHNYLNRVVGDRRIGERIVFQGGTAFNQAVVAAFRAVTGKEIMVTPHHEVTGAIGVAMLARERAAGASRFRGFDFSRRKYNVRTFVCRSCDNLCEIREVRLDGEKPLYYGSRCEKYDVERHAKASSDLPDLFAERQALLLEAGKDLTAGVPKAKGRVGIPLALAFYEFLPFWRTFFESLGFEVVLSHPTTKLTADKGVEHVAAETCFPVKVAHGHLLDLLEQRPDFLFLPSLIDSGNEDFGPNDRTAFHCPLIQAFPYIARSSLDLESRGVRVLSPPLHMQWGREHLAKTLARSGDLLKSNPREIRRALERAEAAQAAFQEALERRGREALAQVGGDRLALAVVARPYNGCDLGANLDLPRKIRILGALPIPLDMLPLSDAPLPPRWRRLYWRHGQRIMKAAKFIRRQANLFGVYVTNFGCGPDSFLTQYFRDEMAGRPFLQLEIDEHSADAGLITRCEAFLDTLENYTRKAGRADASSPERAPRVFTDHRRIYISNMAPQAQALAAAMRAKGRDAVVMAMSDEESARTTCRSTRWSMTANSTWRWGSWGRIASAARSKAPWPSTCWRSCFWKRGPTSGARARPTRGSPRRCAAWPGRSKPARAPSGRCCRNWRASGPRSPGGPRSDDRASGWSAKSTCGRTPSPTMTCTEPSKPSAARWSRLRSARCCAISAWSACAGIGRDGSTGKWPSTPWAVSSCAATSAASTPRSNGSPIPRPKSCSNSPRRIWIPACKARRS